MELSQLPELELELHQIAKVNVTIISCQLAKDREMDVLVFLKAGQNSSHFSTNTIRSSNPNWNHTFQINKHDVTKNKNKIIFELHSESWFGKVVDKIAEGEYGILHRNTFNQMNRTFHDINEMEVRLYSVKVESEIVGVLKIGIEFASTTPILHRQLTYDNEEEEEEEGDDQDYQYLRESDFGGSRSPSNAHARGLSFGINKLFTGTSRRDLNEEKDKSPMKQLKRGFSVEDDDYFINKEFYNFCKDGSTQKVRNFYDKHQDSNILNINWSNAKFAFKSPLYVSAKNGRYEVVELLLEWGADIEIQNDKKKTPLYGAARRGFPQIVELLLFYEADINSQDSDKLTPLMRSARENQADVVRVLLKHGAEASLTDKHVFFI